MGKNTGKKGHGQKKAKSNAVAKCNTAATKEAEGIINPSEKSLLKHRSKPNKGSSRQNHVISMNEGGTLKRQKPKQVNGSKAHTDEAFVENKEMENEDGDHIVLWRYPITTIHYFLIELLYVFYENLIRLWNYKNWVLGIFSALGLIYLTTFIDGPHQPWCKYYETQIWWWLWWVWLGILSSVGLGTGLHTFLLYLGPFIASVTMAAYSCNSVNFPSPPYPDEILCPSEDTTATSLSILDIMSQVRVEAFLWGLGTAIGELPPYFMARGARLSQIEKERKAKADGTVQVGQGDVPEEIMELKRIKNQENMSRIDRAKLSIQKLVESVGFFGILACASIPNPLFDLAGITCGHFLVPFWTFFGATVIGKAVIKMHIQKMFVIIAFNEVLLERAVEMLNYIPAIGSKLQQPFKVYLEKQKQKFRRKAEAQIDSQSGVNYFSWVFEKFIVLMITYFVISIVNSFAQNYHKRLHKKESEKEKVATD